MVRFWGAERRCFRTTMMTYYRCTCSAPLPTSPGPDSGYSHAFPLEKAIIAGPFHSHYSWAYGCQ
eukprot:1018265-Rhodomonas_salina.1